MSETKDVTALLRAWSAGDARAREQAIASVHAELRRLAGAQLRAERSGHTLQPTALVHEAYLRLVDQDRVDWQNRAQFFAVAARLMRRILVDHARRRRAAKRGSGAVLSLDTKAVPEASAQEPSVDVIALDEALQSLAARDERLATVVEMRFFAGMEIEEVATALGVSPATVKRDWTTARAFLYRELHGGPAA